MVRTFVAIRLPQELKTGLTGIQSDLDRAGRDVVRWVSGDGMHLTLKFLGEIPEDSVPRVEEALSEAVRGLRPFTLETAELGFFPNASRPKVFWTGLKGEIPSLLQLQDNVETALEALGFQRESREFSPHLTLARFKDYASAEQKRAFGEQAARLKAPDSNPIPVDRIDLMKSALNPKGAVYTVLASFQLEG